MPYDSDKDPYLDPDTGILMNSLGIVNEADLEDAETTISVATIASLEEHPVLGEFDLTHLQAIHAEIFGDIYPWAGQIRTINISKGDTHFANSDFIEPAAANLFGELKNENWLKDLADGEYAERLAHYYSEVNVLHPFREGNGRAQRGFFTLLAVRSRRHIAWDELDADANIAASVKAYRNNDETDLAALLAPLIWHVA